MFLISLVGNIAKACTTFTVVAYIINWVMKESSHPNFDFEEYKTQYYQSLVSMTVSGVVMEFIFLAIPGVLYRPVMQEGVGYLIFSSIAYILMFDALNYWMHRLFHTSWLYPRFHSLHHQYRPVMGASSAAITVVDSLFIGQLPVWTPLWILSKFGYGISETSFYLIMLFITVFSMYLHSIAGHKLNSSIFVDNEEHIKHHHLSRCNYGNLFRFWDWACGTYAA